MNSKIVSGLAGIIIGGIWLAMNFKHVETQGFVAIGMPIVIIVLGAIYLVIGLKK